MLKLLFVPMKKEDLPGDLGSCTENSNHPQGRVESTAPCSESPSFPESHPLFRTMEWLLSMLAWGEWGGGQGTPYPLENLLVFSLYVDFQDDMTDSLRDYTNLPEAAPLLTILDMSARAKYVMDVEEITPAIVEAFVNDFLAEKLKPEPI